MKGPRQGFWIEAQPGFAKEIPAGLMLFVIPGTLYAGDLAFSLSDGVVALERIATTRDDAGFKVAVLANREYVEGRYEEKIVAPERLASLSLCGGNFQHARPSSTLPC